MIRSVRALFVVLGGSTVARPKTAGGTKYASSGLEMRDITPWLEELKKDYGVFVRIIWSRGVRTGDWRVTGQAYKVVEDKAVVIAEAYKVWPCKGYKQPEGLMLAIVMDLERACGEPAIGVSAD